MFKSEKHKLYNLIFFEYFARGSVLPILSLYLTKQLGFTGAQTGAVMAMAAISTLTAPFLGSVVADRIISSEKLFALCHFSGALLMLSLSTIQTYPLFLIVYLVYMMFIGPTIPLSTAIIFHHIENGKEDYGNFRVLGTLGWIGAAFVVGWIWMRLINPGAMESKLGDALVISALASIIAGSFGLLITPSGVKEEASFSIIPKSALRKFLNPKIILLSISGLIIYLADRFYFFGTGPFMKSLGFSEFNILPAQSLGQVTEIVIMVSLGTMIKKFGLKKVLILGVVSNIARYAILAFASSPAHILLGVAMHGLAYGSFFSAANIFLDSLITRRNRAGIHQIFRIIIAGGGNILGNFIAGYCARSLGVLSIHPDNYVFFWLIPAVISLGVLIILNKL
ncbi:MAG: MFS transporter [Candidatus Marinimicrobia bacterium]|nr:MFS transporter [Candidatus Neomarinimicrobiota bacterium]